MTIVTKNSLTLSNVNDGTITHYAYANSADGTDRFTTVYPNLNLSNNTQLNYDILPTGISNGGGTDKSEKIAITDLPGFSWGRKYTPSTRTAQSGMRVVTDVSKLKIGDTITNSFWVKNTGNRPIKFWAQIGFRYGTDTEPNEGVSTGWNYTNGGDIEVKNDGKWNKLTFTTIIPQPTVASNRTGDILKSVVHYAYSSGAMMPLAVTDTFIISPLKLELGSTDTPWMPSASEVTTADWPTYMGTYTDTTITDSTNYADYAWFRIKGIDGKDGAPGEDGNPSYMHTAWSYSADGTDRFTTVYPNLNLLTGTSKPFVMGYGIPNTTWDTINKVSGISLPITSTKNEILPQGPGFRYTYIPGVTYTQSIYISTDAPLTGTPISFTWFTDEYGHNTSGVDNLLKVSNNVYRATSTYIWPSSKSPANGRNADLSNLPLVFDFTKGTFLQFYKPKLELGSTATPWMPSSSEVKTSDYPNYIGTYSDNNVESSLDYKKYQWAIFKGQNSNAYMAYSWSADGTDRFTTVYPNLNLLKGTKDSTSITGNNTANQVGLLFPFDNDKTLANQGFNINDILTLEFDWSATNPASGYFILQWQGVPWGFSLPTINISSTNSSGHVVYTFNVRDKDIASTAYATGIGYRLDNIPTNTVITFSNVIIRKANGSQPWMPSESEVQDQWQDAIPMYIGVGEKDSQNPSDYRWQLNPRYVQASSDSGLSNKAGIDDLASVANTANDALVQAQNAVSNEDYTSWLEHDYQTTIDNLQEISAQNQEDVKNVDDRTTIVEGFYGEMKVKWNFIDESFSFSEEGMFISNAQSKMSIQITSDKIVFWDNNVDVAFITGEVLNIQKGVFLESATIGNHLITKFSDSSPVTIIRYVGGIT